MIENKFYTINNNQDYVDDEGFPRSQIENSKVFAKAVKEVRSKNILERSPAYFKYYVRVEPNKTLHDPFMGHSIQTNRTSFVDKICKSEQSFMEVNQSVFTKYINFLKTQNSQWLTDATRELR
jgi:hypothetical protein